MLKIFCNHNLIPFQNRIKYVLKYIERHPFAMGRLKFSFDQKEPYDLELNYGVRIGVKGLQVPAQLILFSEKEKSASIFRSNEYQNKGIKLFSVEEERKDKQEFLQGDRFQFDWIETIFFHISRYEEWNCEDEQRDMYGRMTENAHFLVKHSLEKIPVVDLLVKAILRSFGLSVDSSPSKFCVSHDIDFIERSNTPYRIMKSIVGAIIKRNDFKSARRIWQLRNEVNPYDTFDWMLLKQSGIKKQIYFLVGGESKYDKPYSLNHPVFKKAIQLSEDRGYTIGVHPSFESWKSEEVILEEKQKLEEAINTKVEITRQHFLRFNFPETATIIDRLGLREDSSLGYAGRIGFRCGTGFPYQLYDFVNEKAFSFLETPLVFMDSALFYESDQNPILFEQIWRDFLEQNSQGTQITFNFHNSRFFDAFLCDLPLKKLYKELFLIKSKSDHLKT